MTAPLNPLPIKTALNLCNLCIPMRNQDYIAALVLPKRLNKAQTSLRRFLCSPMPRHAIRSSGSNY